MKVDLLILGSGYGGAIVAMIARRLGYSVLLIEKGKHPRFAIGESSTPLANLLLEEIGRKYDLPGLLPFAKWGSWQKERPHIACGLKRGFSFLHHLEGERFRDDASRDRQLLVAASPHDQIADTHWYRSEFDQHLSQYATELGATLWENSQPLTWQNAPSGCELVIARPDGERTVEARFVVDATGPRGFLWRQFGLGEGSYEGLPQTQTLFSHFRGVHPFALPGSEIPPYPVHAAALHHVFEGGWIWVLHFNNGLTSAGCAVTDEMAGRLRLPEGEGAWRRLLDLFPSIQEQLGEAESVIPFQHWPRLAFLSSRAVGPGWLMLPSAVGIVDPLLSTGFPQNLFGIQRLGKLLEHGLPIEPRALAEYEQETMGDLRVAGELVGALYSNMARFARFRGLALLYFAAAIYSETLRRLGRGTEASGFLLRAHPVFGPGLRQCCALAHTGTDQELGQAVEALLEPFDLGGLSHLARNHWHPCKAEDLLQARDKIGASVEQLQEMLAACGFAEPTSPAASRS